MPRSSSLGLYTRYARFLLHEFRWPLGFFIALVFGGGLIVHLAHESHPSYIRACYEIFVMLAFEPAAEMSSKWYLQIFDFLVPVLGVLLIADGMVRLGILIVHKKARLKEWWIMQASAYRQHIVVVGVGKVGYRIVKELQRTGVPVIGIDRDADKYLIQELQDEGVPVIAGEARLRKTLVEANVAEAQAIICAINDDVANLDIGFTARELNPQIRVVLRIFDDTLAQRFVRELGLPAISTSQTAAHVFVAAATGKSVHHAFRVGDEELHMTEVIVRAGSRLIGATVSALEDGHRVRVVCHRTNGKLALKPDPATALAADDTLILLGADADLLKVETASR